MLLAIISVGLDMFAVKFATAPGDKYALVLVGGRLLCDVSLFGLLWLRSRLVWMGMTTVYVLGILCRAVVVSWLLKGAAHLPHRNIWMLAANFCIAIVSVILLCRRSAMDYFGCLPSAKEDARRLHGELPRNGGGS